MPLYLRGVKDYDDILLPLGFKRVLETYPAESPEFLEKHNIKRTSPHPKYMVLGYKLG